MLIFYFKKLTRKEPIHLFIMLINQFCFSRHFYLNLLIFSSCFLFFAHAQQKENELLFNIQNTKIEIGKEQDIILRTTQPLSNPVNIFFNYEIGKHIKSHFDDNLIDELENATLYPTNGTSNITLHIHARTAGHVIIGVHNMSDLVTTDTFIRVTIEHSTLLNIVTIIIGWLYFVAWSVSFYPQVILNYTRKSVIGLNFDFLAYNITGFIAYSVFNVGMYWVPCIEREYFETNARGVNPVQLNDVIFALHATFITAVTISQTCIYERGTQKVSLICKILFSGMWLFTLITFLLACVNIMTWLLFVYCLSYVKLFVTLIKYVPQVHMNYKLKSTVGWSIWTVLLDFAGGFLSIFQMFLLSYNNDDWNSIFGDPTKFGLGVLSIFFDLIFMLQHYVLYREESMV